jgi:tRNA-Thr(GGU) m(6)t(6)A37 methyltransferase TsaA
MLTVTPIGYARTPHVEKVSAPRQPAAARDVAGTIEVLPEYEHALSDLERIERIWLVFWFHLNEGAWRPKVLPPRSDVRRGVFATRSPHRPNPIGLSCVRLERIDGLVLHVRDLDLVDVTPVLDIKPYLPYADAFPESGAGWLEAPDPVPSFEVRWSDEARARIDWLEERGIDLRAHIERLLALGPRPHPYRRIRKDGDALRLAYKEWRVRFRAEGRTITVIGIASGYRHSQIFAAGATPSLDAHRAFVERFG